MLALLESHNCISYPSQQLSTKMQARHEPQLGHSKRRRSSRPRHAADTRRCKPGPSGRRQSRLINLGQRLVNVEDLRVVWRQARLLIQPAIPSPLCAAPLRRASAAALPLRRTLYRTSGTPKPLSRAACISMYLVQQGGG